MRDPYFVRPGRSGNSGKVQVMRAVGAMQAAGHDKPHATGALDQQPGFTFAA
jgi:hypothetical protein